MTIGFTFRTAAVCLSICLVLGSLPFSQCPHGVSVLAGHQEMAVEQMSDIQTRPCHSLLELTPFLANRPPVQPLPRLEFPSFHMSSPSPLRLSPSLCLHYRAGRTVILALSLPPQLLLKDEKSIPIKLRAIKWQLGSALHLTSSFRISLGKYNEVPVHISLPEWPLESSGCSKLTVKGFLTGHTWHSFILQTLPWACPATGTSGTRPHIPVHSISHPPHVSNPAVTLGLLLFSGFTPSDGVFCSFTESGIFPFLLSPPREHTDVLLGL